jgi:hypothetical protein
MLCKIMTKPQNIIAQISINVRKKKWQCLIQDCEEIAINSHLIQRNGVLSNIVENGHLVEIKMVDAYKWNKKESPINFRIVGVKQALSHKVFCNEHDTTIFKPIEDDKKDFESYDSFLLFSYRAICAEIRKKMVAVEQHTRLINANTLDGKIDKEQLQLFVNGNELGVKDLNVMKKMLKDELEDKKNNYSYYIYKYDKLDIYASAVFSATDIDLPKEDGDLDLENIYIHILPSIDETMILIGYHKEYSSKDTIGYCKSWGELSQEELELKLTGLFANNIENWGLSLSLFKSLKEKTKNKYIELLRKNVSYFGVSKSAKFNLFDNK